MCIDYCNGLFAVLLCYIVRVYHSWTVHHRNWSWFFGCHTFVCSTMCHRKKSTYHLSSTTKCSAIFRYSQPAFTYSYSALMSKLSTPLTSVIAHIDCFQPCAILIFSSHHYRSPLFPPVVHPYSLPLCGSPFLSGFTVMPICGSVMTMIGQQYPTHIPGIHLDINQFTLPALFMVSPRHTVCYVSPPHHLTILNNNKHTRTHTLSHTSIYTLTYLLVNITSPPPSHNPTYFHTYFLAGCHCGHQHVFIFDHIQRA